MILKNKEIRFGTSDTKFGNCFIAWFDNKICQLSFFDNHEKELERFTLKFKSNKQVLDNENAAKIIDRIFEQGEFPDIYLEGTPFQQKVWKALLEIPSGSTTTYADIARATGHPKAVRAAGTAIGANPIAVLIPCHRVVRTDGGLGGYRWGLDVKKKLLAFEGKRI